MKLDSGQKRLLRLINNDADENGWAKVSEPLCSIIEETAVPSLMTFEKLDIGGRIKLTEEGKAVLKAMDYL